MNLNFFIENNKSKIITYLMVYLIIPALLYVPTVMFSDKFMDNILLGVIWLFFVYIGMILFFLPTYLVLYFLFKKIKNIKTKYILFSISIPLTIFIYFLITYIPCISVYMGLNTLLFTIGLFWMLFVLPISFITTLCTPKKYLDEKYYNLACIFLTEIFVIISFIITIFVSCQTFN